MKIKVILDIKVSAFLKYAIAISLMFIAVYSVAPSGAEITSITNLFECYDIVVSLLFSILVFYISGVKLAYLFNKNTNKKLSRKEIVSLPIEMNFWGYIIPAKGGMIYALVLLKIKHGVTFRSTTSIFLFVQFLILILGGGVGLVYVVNQKAGLPIGVEFGLLLCIVSPLIAFLGAEILDSIKKLLTGRMVRMLDFLVDSIRQSVAMFTQWKLLFIVSAQTILHVLVTAIWLCWLSTVINFELNLYVGMLLVCVQQLATSIRIIPGNLGINELLMGGSNFLFGGGFEEGVILALAIRVTTLFVTFTVGSYMVYKNLEFFSVRNISQLYKQLSSRKEI